MGEGIPAGSISMRWRRARPHRNMEPRRAGVHRRRAPRQRPDPFHDDSALSGHSRNAFRSCSRPRRAFRSSKTDVQGVLAPTCGDRPPVSLVGAGRWPSRRYHPRILGKAPSDVANHSESTGVGNVSDHVAAKAFTLDSGPLPPTRRRLRRRPRPQIAQRR